MTYDLIDLSVALSIMYHLNNQLFTGGWKSHIFNNSKIKNKYLNNDLIYVVQNRISSIIRDVNF